ncbi:MAG: protein kinase [Pseudomonadota bacterium]
MGNANKKVDQQDESYVDELAPGTELLHGQFKIDEFLNSGGFGITYLARDSLNRPVVIKECFPSTFCHRSRAIVQPRSRAHQQELTSVVDLFVQEARSLAKLDHPNIVGVHQVFEDNSTAYMVLDFVEGRDLLDILEDDGHTLTAPQIKGILKDVLGAVAYIHDQDLLHRDISPDNILLDVDLRPVLIDFGAAREEATKKSRVLSALRVVKDGYSPQEFYVQGSAQTPSSDLYALGASFYHLIVGETPPNSQARLAAIASGEKDPYEPLVDRIKGFDKKFLNALDKSLQILPKDRVQSAQEWLELMEGSRRRSRVVTSTPIPMSSAAAATAAAEKKSNSKLAPLLGSAAAIAIIAVVGLVATGAFDSANTEIELADTTPAAKTGPELAAASAAAQRNVELAATKTAEVEETARLAQIEAEQAAERRAAEEAAAKAAEEEAQRLAEAAAAEAAAQREAEIAAIKAAEEAEAARLAQIEEKRLEEIAAAEAAAQREAEIAAAKAAEEAEAARLAKLEAERLAEAAAAEAAAQRAAEIAAAKAAEEAEAARLAQLEAKRLAEAAAAEAAAQRAAEIAAAKAAEEAEAARLAEQEKQRLEEIAAAKAAAQRAAEIAAAKAAEEAEATRIAEQVARAKAAITIAEEKVKAELLAKIEAEKAAEEEAQRLANAPDAKEAKQRSAERASITAALSRAATAREESQKDRNAALTAQLFATAAANSAEREARQAERDQIRIAAATDSATSAGGTSTDAALSTAQEMSVWSVDLPFKGKDDTNVIGEVGIVSPAWALTGTRIIAVNGTPIDQMNDISEVLRNSTRLGEQIRLPVVLRLQPADGAAFDQKWEFPIVQETVLPNNMTFMTRYVDNAWKTFVTENAENGGNFQIGDVVVALMSTNEAIESRTAFADIIEREHANGNEQLSFAVSRSGSMWVVSMTYADGV